jgi:hypothetical protein
MGGHNVSQTRRRHSGAVLSLRDDGFPPSIVGSFVANKAEIVVTSARVPASLRVSLERYVDGLVDYLHWKALEPNTVNDALLPVNVSLTRATTANFAPEYASTVRKACESVASR